MKISNTNSDHGTTWQTSNSDVSNHILSWSTSDAVQSHMKTVQENAQPQMLGNQAIYKSNSDVSNHVLSWYQFRNTPAKLFFTVSHRTRRILLLNSFFFNLIKVMLRSSKSNLSREECAAQLIPMFRVILY